MMRCRIKTYHNDDAYFTNFDYTSQCRTKLATYRPLHIYKSKSKEPVRLENKHISILPNIERCLNKIRPVQDVATQNRNTFRAMLQLAMTQANKTQMKNIIYLPKKEEVCCKESYRIVKRRDNKKQLLKTNLIMTDQNFNISKKQYGITLKRIENVNAIEMDGFNDLTPWSNPNDY